MKKEKKKKKKQKRSALSVIFLILAILFFLLAVAGFAGGVVIVGVFCLAGGAFCLLCRRAKRSGRDTKKIESATCEKPAETVKEKAAESIACKKPVEVASEKIAPAAASSAPANSKTVKVIFPDGHSEQHKINDRACDVGCCLTTENGRTYHNKTSCFLKWSDEYRSTFDHWRFMTIDDAEQMGMRRCNFCFAYEIAKDDHNASVLTISCGAQKYQDNISLCSVGEQCEIEWDCDSDRYVVVCGDEIGYLTEKQIDAHCINIYRAKVFIDEITEQENGKYKVKIIVH